jgi:hypothetical protein
LDDCNHEFTWIQPKNNNEKELLIDNIRKDSKYKIITTTNSLISELTDDIRNIKNPQDENEPKKEYKEDKKIFRVGDPVIHCKNNNELGLVNGNDGYVVNIELHKKIIVDNKGKVVNNKKIIVEYDKNNGEILTNYNKNDNMEFPYDEDKYYIEYDVYDKIINELNPAYMITIHKSQNQEYAHIIVVLCKSIMLNRNLLYTALSRAKQTIILISTEENLKKCIKRKVKRNSLLDYIFRYYNNKQLIEFIDYYKNNESNNNENDEWLEIIYKGDNYIYNKNTDKVYIYKNQIIGDFFGIYNQKTNKIKISKN